MTRYVANRTEAKALEAALLTATGKRWAVRYHKGTARGWFDVLPMARDRRTIYEQHCTGPGEYVNTSRYLRGEELESARKNAPWSLKASPAQVAVLKALFGEYYFHDSNVPGDEAWLTWAASGKQGVAPRRGRWDWD